ncbi:MAG: hypothetical protein JO253_09260, partial [Alphaproteobacteria bacterium]|nr:hypothetical protein [Alphaproteobacteria bacterium]
AYLAAEQAAEIQHAGLWSVALTPPAAQLVGDAAKTEATAPTKAEAAKAEPVVPKAEIPIKEPAVIKETHENESRQIPVHVGSPGLLYTTDLANSRDDDAGFFQHYQVLIAGGLMFITTFGTVLTLVLQRRYEKREEMKAIAAALRGELMAARAVCMTRLKTIHTDDDDRAATWPRLRSTLYQAYVGKLGWLGAQLSRQIASIYGQASDYAAYYNSIEDATQAPKRRALQTLSGYIDEVLPRLEWVEVTGRRPAPGPASLSHHVEPVAHETILPESVTVEHAPALALPQPAWASVANLPSGLWQAVRQFVHQHLPTQQAANAGSEGQDYDMMLEHSLQPVTFHESAEPEVVEPATSTTPSAPAPVTTPEKPANDTAAAAESVTAAVVKTHTA